MLLQLAAVGVLDQVVEAGIGAVGEQVLGVGGDVLEGLGPGREVDTGDQPLLGVAVDGGQGQPDREGIVTGRPTRCRRRWGGRCAACGGVGEPGRGGRGHPWCRAGRRRGVDGRPSGCPLAVHHRARARRTTSFPAVLAGRDDLDQIVPLARQRVDAGLHLHAQLTARQCPRRHLLALSSRRPERNMGGGAGDFVPRTAPREGPEVTLNALTCGFSAPGRIRTCDTRFRKSDEVTACGHHQCT
jgi:hypothetical protein